jgi:hypothetical protein
LENSNINGKIGDTNPVDQFKPFKSMHDVVGNVLECTQDDTGEKVVCFTVGSNFRTKPNEATLNKLHLNSV